MFTTPDQFDPGTALARLDLNSPVEDGAVQDNKRFERHAETVRDLLDHGHGVALVAHQGRPGRDTHVSLEQHADILSNHVGQDIEHVPDVHGPEAQDAVRNLSAGEAVLLENVRFVDHELEHKPGEEHAKSPLVNDLAGHADFYVNDAYSAAHRPHASLVGFPHVLDSAAGGVMEQEYTHNTRIHDRMDGKTVMAVGGKKAGDVLHVMEELADNVDTFLVGGLIAELFLRANGFDVGFDVDDSRFMHDQWLEHRDAVKHMLAHHAEKLELPRDLAYHNDDRMREEVLVENAAKSKPYWDIGRNTVEAFTPHLKEADAVFVKGAMGVFEDRTFRYGTKTLLETIADSPAFSVVGGGDTSRAVDMYGLDEQKFDHVSIAGGAYIRALTGEALPAVEALRMHA